MSLARARLAEEIAAIPDERIPELLRLVHGFRVTAADDAASECPATNDFAGVWADLPDTDFDAFLEEVGERRRQAFRSRPTR